MILNSADNLDHGCRPATSCVVAPRARSGRRRTRALTDGGAVHHGRTLLTADRRAAAVYRLLGVAVEFLGDS